MAELNKVKQHGILTEYGEIWSSKDCLKLKAKIHRKSI